MHAKQIVEPVQEFGMCLKGVLRSRKVSASELARMMAYRSRNSIFRILDETGGHNARQAFFDRLTKENPLGLSAQEHAALEQALEVSRVGRHAFLSNCAMHEMLMNEDAGGTDAKVRIEAIENNDDPYFRQALEEMAHGKKAYITITGCCDRAIFEALREWIHKTDAGCEVKVKHLIYTGAEEIVHNISAIQPLLYCDFYTAYCIDPGILSREREALYRQNCIYIQTMDAQGVWMRQTLLLIEKGMFVPMEKALSAQDDRFMRCILRDLDKMPLLKAELPDGRQVESYLSYTESCRKLEAGRAVYTIKPDITLSCVHPDILLPCVREEFWQAAGEKAEEMKQALYRIHLARWENFFGARKGNHMILSQKAMEEFAQTGRQSDHFFAIRPYTPQERVRILSQIRAQLVENPGFRVTFFREEYTPPVMEIGLYEGIGTLMTKPLTHYDLSGDHAEAVITQKEFCERYREYYIHDLLERRVISKEETLALMDRLIGMAASTSELPII